MTNPVGMVDVLQHVRTFPIAIFEYPSREYPIQKTGGVLIGGVYRSQATLFKILTDAALKGLVTHEVQSYERKNFMHRFELTAAGRLEARGGVNSLSLEEARATHDNELQRVWGDHPMAQQVLAGRTKAAAHIRLIVARVFARGDMMSFDQWHVIPCLTDKGTLGMVDVAHGTAWDTGVDALPEVHDLGVEAEACATANNGLSAVVLFDGIPVQSQGTAVVNGKVVPPSMPAGWRQIILPCWRGYEGTSGRHVPSTEFPPETWIKPTLASAGLMTCYGKLGDPQKGAALMKTYGWHEARGEWHPNRWPMGVPSWIDAS